MGEDQIHVALASDIEIVPLIADKLASIGNQSALTDGAHPDMVISQQEARRCGFLARAARAGRDETVARLCYRPETIQTT